MKSHARRWVTAVAVLVSVLIADDPSGAAPSYALQVHTSSSQLAQTAYAALEAVTNVAPDNLQQYSCAVAVPGALSVRLWCWQSGNPYSEDPFYGEAPGEVTGGAKFTRFATSAICWRAEATFPLLPTQQFPGSCADPQRLPSSDPTQLMTDVAETTGTYVTAYPDELGDYGIVPGVPPLVEDPLSPTGQGSRCPGYKDGPGIYRILHIFYDQRGCKVPFRVGRETRPFFGKAHMDKRETETGHHDVDYTAMQGAIGGYKVFTRPGTMVVCGVYDTSTTSRLVVFDFGSDPAAPQYGAIGVVTSYWRKTPPKQRFDQFHECRGR